MSECMFKYKPDKLKNQKEIITLDETHKAYVKKFENNKNNLSDKKQQLIILNKKLQDFNLRNQATLTMEDIKHKTHLKEDIDSLNKSIYDIEHHKLELEYYSKTNDILLKYYDIIDNNETQTSGEITNQIFSQRPTTRKRSRNIPIIKKDILCFFNDNKSNSKKDIKNNENQNELPKNKAYLHDQYMKVINNFTVKKTYNTSKICEKCGIERTLVQSDGIYVCGICGEVESALIESDIPNYKDSVTEKPSYPYKRLNHLVEWLNQFQAKESTDIPKDVYESILKELKRSRVVNLKDVSIVEMKIILKKLKLNSYYEHIPHIMSKISGHPPPTLDRETEDKIKQMFKDIQEPFSKYCPKERTNFLSYSYVLHKFFQILNMPEFVKHFPLLKSREKLHLQDKMWKQICNDLDWEYYSSI